MHRETWSRKKEGACFLHDFLSSCWPPDFSQRRKWARYFSYWWGLCLRQHGVWKGRALIGGGHEHALYHEWWWEQTSTNTSWALALHKAWCQALDGSFYTWGIWVVELAFWPGSVSPPYRSSWLSPHRSPTPDAISGPKASAFHVWSWVSTSWPWLWRLVSLSRGLNVCVFLKFIGWNPNPQCDS